jgi:hypothetical protein
MEEKFCDTCARILNEKELKAIEYLSSLSPRDICEKCWEKEYAMD